MELELGHVPDLQYVFEYPQGWLAMCDHGEWGGGIEWWDRSLDGGQRVMIGADDSPQNVVRAIASGDVILVLQAESYARSIGQLAELWREHDHFTSRVIARYDRAPSEMLAQPDGSWLVLVDDALWRTRRTGSVELIARLPSVYQYHASLATDDAGRLYLAGAVGVLRLTPRWDSDFGYVPDLLLPEGSSFERCWSGWLSEAGAIETP
jgi:hypothetical protein